MILPGSCSNCLRRPGDYAPAEGARFEVHIENGRGIHGVDARPFEARLAIVVGRTVWSMKESEDVERARVATLLGLGFSIRNIAEEIHSAMALLSASLVRWP